MPKPPRRRIRPGTYQLQARRLARRARNVRGEARALFRQYQFDVLALGTPVVAVESNGIRYYVSTLDKEVSRKTFMWGNFAEDQLALAVELVEARTRRRLRGMELIDIGANIGTTTMPA